MRFEVRYATGAQHEITLQGTSAVVGRDPTCDLVLNDSRCSRRHAVVEAGPQGLAVRDAGSANGIFVNGRKVDRSPLNPGDIVRLGETQIRVLPEEISGTMVMGPDEATDFEATQEAVVPPEVLSSPPVTPSPAPSPPIPAAPAPKASPPPPVAPPPAPVVA